MAPSDLLPTQLRRGVLEFCVLALLAQHESYGFDLVRRLSATSDGLVTTEGTIYPLLSRLRRDGWVATTWHESEKGPPRRYYCLTRQGAIALKNFEVEWDKFTAAVDSLLHQKGLHEPRNDPGG